MSNLLAQGNAVDDVKTIKDFEGIFGTIVSVTIAVAGIVLFIMLIMGGFNYLTAGSEPQKAEAAKKTITYAILGLVFIALAFLILRLIASFTGVEGILQFNIVR